MITGTHLNEQLAGAFVKLSTRRRFRHSSLYSSGAWRVRAIGRFKWVIEAPYVMAVTHPEVHLGWIVSAYDLGGRWPISYIPFWMLPTLGVFRLGARDVMGYTRRVPGWCRWCCCWLRYWG